MFPCPPQNYTMAQYFSQAFPKPGRNVFELPCRWENACRLPIHVGKVRMRVEGERERERERERDENAALESETETANRRFGRRTEKVDIGVVHLITNHSETLRDRFRPAP